LKVSQTIIFEHLEFVLICGNGVQEPITIGLRGKVLNSIGYPGNASLMAMEGLIAFELSKSFPKLIRSFRRAFGFDALAA